MKVIFFGEPESYVDQREYRQLIESATDQLGVNVVSQRDTLSRDSIASMELYQIFNTPAVLICREDGALVALWQHSIPSMSDIGYHYQSER